MKDALESLERFHRFSELWEKDRDAEMESFISSDPHLSDYEQRIIFYEQLEKRIHDELEQSICVGPLAIYTGL